MHWIIRSAAALALVAGIWTTPSAIAADVVFDEKSDSVRAMLEDGSARLQVSCRRSIGVLLRLEGVRMGADGGTSADARGDVEFAFMIGGAMRRLSLELRAGEGQGPGDVWRGTAVRGSGWLDAWAGGRRMILRDAEGVRLADFSLDGSSLARDAFRRRCGV